MKTDSLCWLIAVSVFSHWCRQLSAVPMRPNINCENISSSSCYRVICWEFERSIWLLCELGFSILTRLKPKRGMGSAGPPNVPVVL